ncbi:putative tellurium resistance membrane protein TerC [Arthrobacter sp. V4I6]|nr:putative tellurium resistance membrane protein TerC [Arthrobacter sp. V1I7]MDQ0852009.1 putative tellurium resistance membrane protein TerC [Arthrobacter sp. V4I6]
MGLRQLFFGIDGLLDRLVYLSRGLAANLGFIDVKLFLHALRENTCRSSTTANTSTSLRSAPLSQLA